MKAIVHSTHGALELDLMYRYGALVCGVDEAGRGPLAGPVVAAAVMFAPGTVIKGISDSKALSAIRREELAALIHDKAVSWATAEANVEEIDSINILQASLLAMRRAVAKLDQLPGHILVDGNKTFATDIPITAIVKGDSLCFSIAAASILAKTVRDAIMRDLDKQYPCYGFASHKGYGTRAHVEALRTHGPSPQHRRSFIVRAISQQPGIFHEHTGSGPRGRRRGSGVSE